MTAAEWVEQLARLMAAAGETTDSSRLSGLLAQIQRMSGWALRASVGEARESGVSWRELAPHVGVPFATLHRQYQAGGGLQLARPGTDDVPPAVDPAGAVPPADEQGGEEAGAGDADPDRAGAGGADPHHLRADTSAAGASGAVADAGSSASGEPGSCGPDAGGPVADAGPGVGADPEPGPRAGELPAPLDSFVGRQKELADLSRLLGRNRLMTVTGPAGAGKTRLVLEAASRARRTFGDEVWLIELASVSSPDLVPQTIAAALGVPEQAGQSLVDTVAVALGKRRTLLVVDNCEHVIDACALHLEALLRRCAGLRVLATSREPLQIVGEVIIGLEPLPVPDVEGPVDRAALLRSDAVRLFLDRARAGQPDFELTPANGPAIAAVCVHLDGLPLAIELATRRLRTLPPEQLLAHLEDRFHLLAMPRRQAPGRRRSLQAAIDWSHGMLSATEQAVFRRLAVFAGGFDLTAATAVCAGDGITPADVLDALTSLEAKSLLTATPDGRFRQLESIRMYGRERLSESGEQVSVHDRLLDWLAGMAEPLTAVLSLRAQLERPLMVHQDNLAYAVEWAIEHDDGRQVLLAVALAKCWRQRGYPAQGVPLLDRVLSHAAQKPEHRALALGEAGFLATRAGDHERGLQLGTAMAEIAREQGHNALHAKALMILGTVYETTGDLPAAIRCYRQRLELARTLAAPAQTAMAMNNLSWCLLQLGDLDEAAPLLDTALVMLGPETTSMHSSVRHTIAALALVRGDPDTAERRLRENLRVPNQDADEIAYDIEGFAIIFAQRRQPERALRLAAAVRALRARLQMQPELWWQQQTDDAVTAAQDMLPAGRVRAAAEAGARLSLQQAVAYALEQPGDVGDASREIDLLTAREQQVAALVAQGLTNVQIAHRLGMSERTVVSHLEHIRAKLDLPSRAQIAVWAAEQELVRS